jgi:hypothetical protein
MAKSLAIYLTSMVHFKRSSVFNEQIYAVVNEGSSMSSEILTSKLIQHLGSVGAFLIDNGI